MHQPEPGPKPGNQSSGALSVEYLNSVDPTLSVEPTRPVQRNGFAERSVLSSSQECESTSQAPAYALSSTKIQGKLRGQNTLDSRSEKLLIASFENRVRDDRLLNVHHGIVKLLAERVHGDPGGGAASARRIQRMYTDNEFPPNMMDVEKTIYMEFNRLSELVGARVRATISSLTILLQSHMAPFHRTAMKCTAQYANNYSANDFPGYESCRTPSYN
jgi:hypothetical protein